MTVTNPPVITILGPTASGKTSLSLEIAKKYDGEIICADSRTVYRGMDIGTAKPTLAEQKQIKHHLLDIAEPNNRVTAAQFKNLASNAITNIAAKGKIAFLVGGSGLYLNAVLYDYQFPAEAAPNQRLQLEKMSLNELADKLRQLNPERAELIDMDNKRRVIRALETNGQSRHRSSHIRANTLVLGLHLNTKNTQKIITDRIEKMLSQGFLQEVTTIAERYGWDCEALTGIGYRAFREAVNGQITVDQAAEIFARGDLRLIKKQMTWFKRNPEIIWLEQPAQAAPLVANFLTSQSQS